MEQEVNLTALYAKRAALIDLQDEIDDRLDLLEHHIRLLGGEVPTEGNTAS
ncbi:hypothetical protein [Tardibacter chloracetimidivorans]|uniref:hypothetical protein n=1 Tax=Tardibacter chloracetimidivorans TaxID=1921510 RepID=UPI001300FFA3|nr:hypothetical protein [Tardibacter chloracetimidivorans]